MKKYKHGWRLFGLLMVLAGLIGACTPSKKLIRPSGLHVIRLGEDMPPQGSQSLKGIPLRDSIEVDGEFTWRVAMLDYRQGRVVLEEHFYGSDRLGRIRVETPELRMRNGIRVGMTVEELLKKNGNWFISPLEKYRLFDFYSRAFPGLHFLIDDPARDISNPDYSSYSPDQFAPEARIVCIVLH